MNKYEIINISVEELVKKNDFENVIDIRELQEVNYAKINGVSNIPMNTLLNNPLKYLDFNKKYYIICKSGVRSINTINQLLEHGFDLVNVEGGIKEVYNKYPNLVLF